MNVDRCKEAIKRHEGEVLEIYIDSLGFKTLGVGHLCQPEDPEYDWERMAVEMEDSRWFKQVGRRSVELQETVRNV